MSTERFISSAAAARPHRLLDHVLVCERIKNDAELSRVLRLVPSVISKIRHGHTVASAEVILRMHDAFQIPIAELKRLEADHWAAAARSES